jgi:hypothetical protein
MPTCTLLHTSILHPVDASAAAAAVTYVLKMTDMLSATDELPDVFGGCKFSKVSAVVNSCSKY